MFSLSTSWNAAGHKNGLDIVREIKAAGFDTIELSFALSEEIVNDIAALRNKGDINVSSLHNMCPLPREIEPEEASPDYYSLASPDAEERRLAVEAARNTIGAAKKLGAKAVVLHTGRVQVRDRTRDLAALVGDDKRFNEVKKEMVEDRLTHQGGYLENAVRSIGELVPAAAASGIALGIENRFYYREIPLAEELSEILSSFRKEPVFYWHDVGHAEVFQRLGLASHRGMLERFQNRLLGIHLHDIIDSISDHHPPGFGSFDFEMLKPYVRKDTIKVIEAHAPATAEDLRKSAAHLTAIFGQEI